MEKVELYSVALYAKLFSKSGFEGTNAFCSQHKVFGRFLQVVRYGHDIAFSVYVFISHILCTYFPWKTSKEIELRAEAIRCPLRKTGAF